MYMLFNEKFMSFDRILKKLIAKKLKKNGKSQLDLYLEEVRISFSGNFDVLSYWKDGSNRFCDLARIVCDVLSIPITIVTS